MNVYVVYDSVADKFSEPFISDNDKSAIRVSKRGMPADWLDDFKLYRLVEFTDPQKISRADIVSQEVPLS